MRFSPRLFLCSLAAVVFCSCATQHPDADPLAHLRARMTAHLDKRRFAQAQWGVKVVSLATGKTVFECNADKLMKPASNAKMYTASLALDRLGPDYHIKTSFYAPSKPDTNGTIHGNVLVYGRGDPSFSSRFNGDDYRKSLDPVISAFTKAGIKRIDGDLIGDDSYFRGPPYGSEWAWDDLETYYGAPASALIMEDNAIDLVYKPGKTMDEPCQVITKPATTILKFINRTKTTAATPKARAMASTKARAKAKSKAKVIAEGNIDLYRPLGESVVYLTGTIPLDSKGIDDSVSVPNPALWFVTMLKKDLAKHGITVTGGLHSVNWLDREVAPLDVSNLVEVASVSSRPLSEIVKNTLKPSQNQYAQLLLLQVGAHSEKGTTNTIDTESEGMREMRKFLKDAGIKRGMALLEEGSGLSRGALVTPSASVQLLTYMAHHRYHDIFYNALPIAGVDGTLHKRFKGTSVAGNLHAKTGSLGHVDTLSGYMTTKGNDKLVLSVMLNNYKPPKGHEDGRADIDQLVKMLGDYDGKTP